MKIYTRHCPQCDIILSYDYKPQFNEAVRKNRRCMSCSKRGANHPFFGKHHNKQTIQKIAASKMGIKNPLFGKMVYDRTGCILSDKLKENLSIVNSERYLKLEEKQKTSAAVKIAMHKPDIRKKHIDALHRSKWIKVKTDNGQLELLDKWNRLGFHFEPNYQVRTDTDLFYIDGYDKEKNIVIEYDSKYHKKNISKTKRLN